MSKRTGNPRTNIDTVDTAAAQTSAKSAATGRRGQSMPTSTINSPPTSPLSPFVKGNAKASSLEYLSQSLQELSHLDLDSIKSELKQSTEELKEVTAEAMAIMQKLKRVQDKVSYLDGIIEAEERKVSRASSEITAGTSRPKEEVARTKSETTAKSSRSQDAGEAGQAQGPKEAFAPGKVLPIATNKI